MKIKIGYELGTGKRVDINASHLIVTGVTQLSGKTTTLEALIKRSGLKAIVFKTKIGEKSFNDGTEITPFFRDRSDYDFVKSLIEAYTKEKLHIEKGTLMRLCKGAASLVEIKKRVDEALAEGKLRGLKEEIHTRLQHYLENLIPQIQYANLSKTLSVYEGINIMNLERFSEEAQSLIIQSVADEVLKTMKGVVLVIPEAWKFIPQKYNNPCKRVVESYIRQGATNNNFIFIDSQDMAGVDKIPLKQVSTWILGYQSERNEVKHTLDQIALPKKMKPKEDEIMNLKTGHFIISSYSGVTKVYVQPAWMTDEEAKAIAKGEQEVDDVETPSNLTPSSAAPQPFKQEGVEVRFDDSKIRKQMIELRQDFFNKIEEIQTAIQNAYSEIYNLKSRNQEVDVDEVVSLVLQKIPASKPALPNNQNAAVPLNKEEIISEVLTRMPKGVGGTTYEVAPLEKIRKDFLQEAKEKILADISSLSENAKRLMKYLEAKEKGVKAAEIEEKCFFMKHGGASAKKVSEASLELRGFGLSRKDTSGSHYGELKKRISELLTNHGATEQEITQVYDHVLMELI